MRVAVAGASGLIGSALCNKLRDDGHDVVELVRRPTKHNREVTWNPIAGDLDMNRLGPLNAIVNLAGAPIGGRRWTTAYKQEIRDSRVLGTETLARAAVELKDTMKVFVAGSAIGYYGSRGSEELDEDSSKGTGYLSDVVADWEAATEPARHIGIRVACTRSGLVVAKQGGAFERMLPIFKLGLGGRIASGDQYWSLISLRDEVAAMTFVMEHPEIEGPVNLTGPTPATNREVTKALAKILHRPAALPVPAVALKVALGGLSTEALSSIRVVPSKLKAAGFQWQDSTLEQILSSLAS